MSYLFSTSSVSQSSTKEAELKTLKAALTAVPSGLIRVSQSQSSSSRPRNARRVSSGKGRGPLVRKINASELISKSYNLVGSRPIASKLNPIQQIQASLRYDANILTSSTTVPTYGSSSFVISSFAGFAEYLGLFDQYRFDLIEIWFENISGPASTNADTGTLVTAIDLDDANTPTGFILVENKQSSIVTNGLAGHYHRFVPHMAVAAYSGAFTSFSNAPATWIDSGSPNVQHYGLKAAITATSTSSQSFRMSVRATISFRQPGV